MTEPLFRATMSRIAPMYEVRVVRVGDDGMSPELIEASAAGWEIKAAAPGLVYLQRVSGRREAE